jgi:hypothetical protein
MKTQIQRNHTKNPNKRNLLVAHTNGRISVRINGEWTRRVDQLTQSQFLSLLRADRERLTYLEFRTGRPLTGCPVVVSRPLGKEVAR